MGKDEEVLWEVEGQGCGESMGYWNLWFLRTYILEAKIEPNQSLGLRKKMKTQRIISIIFNGLFINSSNQY